MFCNRCGHSNADPAAFCSVCDHPLDALACEGVVSEAGAGVARPEPRLPDENSPRPSTLGCVLVIRSGPLKGETHSLTECLTRVGRNDDNEIVLDDITVSRHHVTIEKSIIGHLVVDLGSLNGTYVNQARVERTVLRSGDELQVGKFRLVYLDRDR